MIYKRVSGGTKSISLLVNWEKPQNASKSKIVNNFWKNYFFTLVFQENVVLNSPK